MINPVGSRAWLTARYNANSGGVNVDALRKFKAQQDTEAKPGVIVSLSKEAKALSLSAHAKESALLKEAKGLSMASEVKRLQQHQEVIKESKS